MLHFLGSFFKNTESPPADFNFPDGVVVDEQTMDRLKSNGNRQLLNPRQIHLVREKLDNEQKEQVSHDEDPHYFGKSYFRSDEIPLEEALDIVQIKPHIFALSETRFSEKPECYFKLIQKLDENASYGHWYLCKTIIIPRENNWYASEKKQMIEREVSFLKKSGQLIGSHFYKKSRKKVDEFSFIMHIIDGTDLYSIYIQHVFDWPMLMWFDIYIAMLKAIENLAFLHNDIKLENFILNLCKQLGIIDVIPIDFGFSTDLNEASEICKTILGTPGYTAPERFFQYMRDSSGPTLESNIFSFAIVGFILFLNKQHVAPFVSAINPGLASRLKCQQISPRSILDTHPELKSVGDSVKSLLLQMKDAKPENRPHDMSSIIESFQKIRTEYLKERPGEVQQVNKICINEKKNEEARLHKIYCYLKNDALTLDLNDSPSRQGFFSKEHMQSKPKQHKKNLPLVAPRDLATPDLVSPIRLKMF